MSLLVAAFFLLIWSGTGEIPHGTKNSLPVNITPVLPCQGTCASCSPLGISLSAMTLLPPASMDLARLVSRMALQDNFTIPSGCLRDFFIFLKIKKDPSNKSIRSDYRCVIVLLLLISGNVHHNPGPGFAESAVIFNTPTEFKTRSGLGFMHLNVRSMIAKMDMIRIWAHTTDADVIVISETWLNKAVLNKDINIDGYNVYRTDRPKKGGGVAVYVKSKFHVNIRLSTSVSKQFELLALDMEISKTLHITVVGCYRPPSAISCTLPSLMELLSGLKFNEIVLIGDLNWNWLLPASDDFKAFCDSFNLFRLLPY